MSGAYQKITTTTVATKTWRGGTKGKTTPKKRTAKPRTAKPTGTQKHRSGSVKKRTR